MYSPDVYRVTKEELDSLEHFLTRSLKFVEINTLYNDMLPDLVTAWPQAHGVMLLNSKIPPTPNGKFKASFKVLLSIVQHVGSHLDEDEIVEVSFPKFLNFTREYLWQMLMTLPVMVDVEALIEDESTEVN